MNAGRLGGVVLLLFGLISAPVAVTYKVSKDGRAPYTTVQSAVNAAHAGDEVVILDFAVYQEQVTIDSSKNRLTLRSDNPLLSTKPTITFLDNINVGPRNYAESQDQSKINFDMNGAVRVMRAQGVRIEGIILDGGGPAPFAYDAVWEGRYPLFHGNAALTLYVAGDVVVRNCEIQNSYYGIYIKDRNEGGIYANANPADLQPQLVVPLSGFGKTGNHLIERNRIHGNSWGMFLESIWDLGSNIRYNLFYNNHHSETLAAKVKKMPDGANQHGGAFIFKDILLSPVAIYNNTFYHNNLIFCADWQVGGPHLIFNNIYGEPYNGAADGTYQALDLALPNRMHNCLYACQEQKPQARKQEYNAGMQDPETNQYVEGRMTYSGYGYVMVMNGFPNLKPTVQVVDLEIPLSSGAVTRPVTVEWDILAGTIIASETANKPFPASARNRWFEIRFVSTDPEDPDFLTPDWNDSLIQKLVVDQGWAEAGIRDADGTVADIGAIPMGGIPETEALIVPRDPVLITDGTKAKVKFEITPFIGTMSNPKIKYIRWIKNVTYTADIWGTSNTKVILASDIVEVPVPSTPLVMGTNTLTFTIPSMTADYGFFDIIVEGTTSKGETVATSVGFLPYRKIDYIFDVVIMDEAGKTELTTVQAGQKVQLWITPRRIDGKAFDAKVDKVDVSLSSNYNLLTPSGAVFELPGGIQGTSKSTVVFTKVPDSGFDGVDVSGMFTNPNDPDVFYAIRGSSKDVRILPGPPEKIVFQDPPSGGVGIVDPGTTDPVKVQALDKYDNKINTVTSISLESTRPEIGKVISSPMTTDTTGLAVFRVTVMPGGQFNDTFPIVATLAVNGAKDNAKMVVGKPRDKLWIFFSDVGDFDPAVKINGCSGTRVPVTIWVSNDGKTPIATQTSQITIDLSAGLAAYASENSDDTTRLVQSALDAGKKVVWIKATTRNIANGTINVFTNTGTVVNALREGINFAPCNSGVKRAAYFASNGRGSVDRVEMYFDKVLSATELPDSMRFFWPGRDGESRLVGRSAITVDPEDSTHLSVMLQTPFAQEITKYSGSSIDLGVYYWWNPLTPDAPTQTGTFAIADSVGPLLSSATVVERLAPGSDTLYISFTEGVAFDVVKGLCLTLIKNGKRIPLEVEKAMPQEGTPMIRAVVKDPGVNSPGKGDSLMIIAEGPIVDGSGNHAHPQNRPVVIEIRQIPADIAAAWYEDSNADGKIDRVHILFNKKVNLSQMELSFVWNGTNALKNGAAISDRISWADTTETAVAVDIESLFGEGLVRDKTSGNMQVHVVFTSFTEGNTRGGIAADKAAPVLTSAEYHLGRTLESGVAADTVVITLSEASNVQTGDTAPLLFVNASGRYALRLRYLNGTGQRFVYAVEGVEGGTSVPPVNDSAWLNTDPASVDDDLGNIQNNPANKRVALKLILPPFEPEIRYGPNPFSPRAATDAAGRFRLTIRPKTSLALDVGIKASLVIYDKVGNKVKSYPEITSLNTIEKVWDGANEHGRIVGEGTYLGVLRYSFIVAGKETWQPSERILIGVH